MLFLPLVARRAAGFGALLGACMSAAFAAPPAAPVVETSAEIKLLNFDWDVVPRSNYYELWFRANNGAPWVKFMESVPWRPHAFNNISAHLLDWDQARYQVKACNPSGCSSSTVKVKSHMFESLGYFKGSSSYAGAQFGSAAAISEDGQYIAAFAAHEPGGEADPAVIYIFSKASGSWRREARIVPSPSTDTRKNRGLRSAGEGKLALSADGSTLAVGMPYRNNTGIGTRSYGSVGVYRRSGTTWTREYQEINPDYQGVLGPIQLSESGTRLVYHLDPATPLQVLEHTAAGWVKSAPIPDFPKGTESYFCSDRLARLSGDGNTLARVCNSGFGDGSPRPYLLVIATAPDWAVKHEFSFEKRLGHGFNTLAIDYDGNTLAFSTNPGEMPIDFMSQVYVWKIVNGALQTSLLHAGDWTDPAGFSYHYGDALALSRDGAWLAVSDPWDRGAGMGVLSPPLQPTQQQTGATYVYDVRNATPQLRRVLKPNNPFTGLHSDPTVAFGNNGKSLLIADPRDDSAATGIDGNRNDTSKPDAGAVWLY
jgi:trimeric autotransporter adhesin